MKIQRPLIGLCLVGMATLIAVCISPAGETEVSVRSGKVRAQAGDQTLIAAAGQKLILKEGEKPLRTVDDPLARDLFLIDKWVQEEKRGERVRIDHTSVQVYSIDDENAWRTAVMVEMLNKGKQPSKTCRIGLTAIQEQATFYDMAGKILPFELEAKTKTEGYYHLQFEDPVAPGETFKFICVNTNRPSEHMLWKEGGLWYVRPCNDTRHCLNYFRTVLPRSAVFVDCTRPVASVDSAGERPAVTVRNYTGAGGVGSHIVAFLWPEKDGTSLADLPPRYRGLRDPRDAKLSEGYRQQMQKILNGEKFSDQSTPLGALLTLNCAIVQKDKELLYACSYLAQKDAAMWERWSSRLKDLWGMMRGSLVDGEELLSTPPWPAEPKEGYVHPIYKCPRGSLIRIETQVCVYADGKWYSFGNMGNPWDTNLAGFRKLVKKYR